MSKESLKGKAIVISGVFEKYSRKELKDIISKGGGKASSSISKNTSFILAGDKMGPSKKEKAINWIDVIRDWVEVDNLPNTIVGYKFANGNSSLDFNNINLDKVFISKRPVYDYPYTAHYKGKGEINNIDSFMPKPLSF